jgi:hypothetical protein
MPCGLPYPASTWARLHDALTVDPVARQRLVGGSVTQAQTLILVADVADLALALQLAAKSGGSSQAATVQYGRRPPACVRVASRLR